jgi:hypothetical protein
MDENEAIYGDMLESAEDVNEREADFDQVAAKLKSEHGLDAQVWHSGGGIMVIRVPLVGGYVVNFGTAADMWGGSVELDDEYTGEEIWTSVSSLETDPEFVAGGIAEALEKFV